MQGGLVTRKVSSVRPSVHLSVCLSVKHVDCDKTKEKSVQIFVPHVILKNKVNEGRPLPPEIWVTPTAVERNRLFSVDIRS